MPLLSLNGLERLLPASQKKLESFMREKPKVRSLFLVSKPYCLLELKSVLRSILFTCSHIHTNSSYRAQELVGEVMIYELCTFIQDILEDDVRAREEGDQLPSLIEERAVHEAAANETARQEHEAELRRQEVEKAEEERVLKQMVDEEMSKRHEVRRKGKPSSHIPLRQRHSECSPDYLVRQLDHG